MQNKSISANVEHAPPAVRSVLASGGQPIDSDIRARMEAQFGHDFADVRVHTAAQAAQSARALDARAYTMGRDVVFAEAQYQPQVRQGAELLAHELAHVIQQERGGRIPQVSPGAAHEREADAAARAAVMNEAPVNVGGATGVGIARSPFDFTTSSEAPDLGEWQSRSPNLTDTTLWSDERIADTLGEIQEWLAHQSSTSPKGTLAATAAEDLRGEIDRRAARAIAAAEAEAALDAPAQGEDVADVSSAASRTRRRKRSLPFDTTKSLSLISPEQMCGGRCYTDEEIFKEYNEAKARIAEEDREQSLQGKAAAVNGAIADDSDYTADQIIELFETMAPAERIEVQRRLDMEKVIGALSDFDATRLGAVGPVTAGQEKLNKKRAWYIEQVLKDFQPVAPARAQVFVLYALSSVYDYDAYSIFAQLANDRYLSELLDMPEVVKWIKARGLDVSMFAEPSGSWTSIFPSLGRGLKHIVKDDRTDKYHAQKDKLPGQYSSLLWQMEMAEMEQSFTVKNIIVGAFDEVTFGIPHGAVDLVSTTGSGIADIASGEYEKAGEKLSGAALLVLTHAMAKTWNAARSRVSVGGAEAAVALEADAQATMVRLTERVGTGEIERAGAMIKADPRAAIFVIENGEAGVYALLEAEGNVEVAAARLPAQVGIETKTPQVPPPVEPITEPSVSMALERPRVAISPATGTATRSVAPPPSTTAVSAMEPFPRVDVTQGRAFPPPIEAAVPAESVTSVSRTTEKTTAVPAAVTTAEAAPRPHEVRAQLVQQERDLLKQKAQAIEQEKAFGSQAGDYEAKLENVTTEPQRTRLENALGEAEKKEQAARERIGQLDGELAEVNRKLTELAQQGIDPSSGYTARPVGTTEFVPLNRLDKPPAGILESTGAEAVRGERIAEPPVVAPELKGKRVLSAVESEAAIRTHIEAGAAEDFLHKDALARGEVGVQRYGRVNEGGPDLIMARRNAAGQIEIVFHDATIDVAKKIDTVPASWFAEAEDAIVVRQDGSSRLQLYNPALEGEIRQAFEQGRFVLEATLVEVGPDGVRFTLLSSAPVSPPPKAVP